MHALSSRVLRFRLFLPVLVFGAFVVATPAAAAILSYTTTFSGAIESPPNASPGTGTAQIDIDTNLLTMTVAANWSGLLGNTTVAHIHAPTAVAGTGTAGVATTTPTFPGFPAGVTAGVYNAVIDLTLASSYNAAYVTANGGTVAGARAALLQAIADGKSYFNIHSSMFGGGEIRGFFVPNPTTPATPESWGRIKNTYR